MVLMIYEVISAFSQIFLKYALDHLILLAIWVFF